MIYKPSVVSNDLASLGRHTEQPRRVYKSRMTLDSVSNYYIYMLAALTF